MFYSLEILGTIEEYKQMVYVSKSKHGLTVPSNIFSKACWTPSPDTSLLILRLSACESKSTIRKMWINIKKTPPRRDQGTNDLFCNFVDFINIYNALLSSCYIVISNL